MTSTVPTQPTAPPGRGWYIPKPTTVKAKIATVTGVGIASAGVAAYLFLVDPNNPANLYPKCPMKALTGLDCPGCGGLRATNSLLHGDIAGAVDHNILALVIVPVMLYLLVRWMFGQFGRELPAIRLPRWCYWAVPLSMLVFSVLRNVNYGPFKYFASETY